LRRPLEIGKDIDEELAVARKYLVEAEQILYRDPESVGDFSFVEFEIPSLPFRKPPVQPIKWAKRLEVLDR
jgi:hypothetical protein